MADRKSPHPFHLGDWLQALDDETLGHLRQLADMAMHDPKSIESALEDLLSVVIHVLAAEQTK